MITENYIHSEGRRFDVPIKRKRTKSNVKVGGIYSFCGREKPRFKTCG